MSSLENFLFMSSRSDFCFKRIILSGAGTRRQGAKTEVGGQPEGSHDHPGKAQLLYLSGGSEGNEKGFRF